jgi:hypothetical protein
MEIAIFEPISTGDSDLFGIIVLGAILCLALGLWGWKAKKQVIWMLGFFGVVILGGNAAFAKFSQSYITPIKIYENKVDTPIGLIDFNDLLSAKIVTDGLGVKKTLADNRPPEKVLILESKNQKSVLLAESQYPIMQIKMALDKQMEIYNKK